MIMKELSYPKSILIPFDERDGHMLDKTVKHLKETGVIRTESRPQAILNVLEKFFNQNVLVSER